MTGIFSVYKPRGPSSHDIINQLRKKTGIKKIGHAGTLDPLASGILVVAIGREFTKKLSEIVKKEKEYLAKIKLGEQSTTDDEEGEKKKFKVENTPKLIKIKQVLKTFLGKTKQIPPIFSALKIKGQPAYKLARQGQKPKLKPREVEIKKIEIIKYKWPYLELRIITGPGVYIRALARDIGKKLGSGAYLADLERIRVGDFTKKKTQPLHSSQGSPFFPKCP